MLGIPGCWKLLSSLALRGIGLQLPQEKAQEKVSLSLAARAALQKNRVCTGLLSLALAQLVHSPNAIAREGTQLQNPRESLTALPTKLPRRPKWQLAAAQDSLSQSRKAQHDPDLSAGDDPFDDAALELSQQELIAAPSLLKESRELALRSQAKRQPGSVLIRVAGEEGEAAEASASPLFLNLQWVAGKLQASAPHLQVPVGASVQVRLPLSPGSSTPQVFVRDQDCLTWEPETSSLQASKAGDTELLIYHQGQLAIVPISVSQGLAAGETTEEDEPDLREPDPNDPDLQDLDAQDLGSETGLPTPEAAPAWTAEPGPVQAFKALRSKTAASVPYQTQEAQFNPFRSETAELSYKKVRFQVLDEQSDVSKKRIVPAKGVQVQILGTEFREYTDAKGLSPEVFVPANAHFFVSLGDAYGFYRPSLVEVDSEGETSRDGVISLRLMQKRIYQGLTAIAGRGQDEQGASLCGRIFNAQGKLWSGISVRIFGSEESPLYFNRFGFVDGKKTAVGDDGRFCFFDVEAGPVALNFYAGDSFLDTIPFSVFAGKHSEQDFALELRSPLRTHLAALPSVQEQRLLPAEEANRLHPVDMADLLALGDGTPFAQLDYGLLAAPHSLPVFKGRSCYIANSPEFALAHYCYRPRAKVGRSEHVTPLIPNDFLEQMALAYNVALQLDPVELDPLLGSAVIEHGSLEGQGTGSDYLSIQLLNAEGEAAAEGVHFGAEPITKAIFFNLLPGSYTVVVKDDEGSWLAIDTLTVYSKTLSYLRTGSQLRYFPKK